MVLSILSKITSKNMGLLPILNKALTQMGSFGIDYHRIQVFSFEWVINQI